mmetsp:Transcript_9754/g.11824  ORF Transcript_9754/g.11824 Transcript_9754/m.11824 type:complete len:108 (-) Transcript_9754:429-752(-)
MLCQYAMLKAVPNKNAGFIILFTSILSLFFFGEIRNLTTLCVLPLVNNGFSLSFFFLSFLSYLWIGAQFPQEKFLSSFPNSYILSTLILVFWTSRSLHLNNSSIWGH